MRVRGSRTTHSVLRPESGIVLLQVLVFSLVLSLITFSLVGLSMTEYATVNAADQGMRALLIADGAVERAVAVLRADPNWNDGVGADKNANNTSWQALYDQFQAGGAGNAVGQAYPAGVSGQGTGRYSLFVKRPGAGSGLNPVNYIWVRAQGQTGFATRSIEILLQRMTPLDFALYVAQPLADGVLGNSINAHGTAYFHSDISLANVVAKVFNDRALATGDGAPYANQLYVRGTLTMNSSTPVIGLLAQPMFGVHASRLKLSGGASGNLSTLELDTNVPDVGYPNVSAYVTDLLTSGGYGNPLGLGNLTMTICTKPLGLWVTTPVPALIFGATYFVVPTKAYNACDANVTNPGNYMLIYDPAQPVQLQLNSAYKNLPIVVPSAVVAAQNVTYSGIGTIVVASTVSPAPANALDLSFGQFLASSRATGVACGGSITSSMPQTDLLSMVMSGSAILIGGLTACAQEQDLALVVGSAPSHLLASLLHSQIYGLVLTESLSLSQNYDFWQMPDLWANLPSPMTTLLNYKTSMPVKILQWHELQN